MNITSQTNQQCFLLKLTIWTVICVAETHYMFLTVVNVLVVATFLADLVVALLAD